MKDYFIKWSKWKKLFGLIFLCLTILFAGAFTLNYRHSRPLPEVMPEDFSFVYQYGVDGKNELDVKNGMFTKDMVVDPSITAELKLTKAELTEIYTEMRKIKITDYPVYFGVLKRSGQTPFETYNIQINYSDKMKKIRWIDGSFDSRKKAEDLRGLFQKIKEIIMRHEEYKKMPEPRAGYA